MRIEINTRTRTVWVWTRSRAYNDATFESKHPRDKDGKFTKGQSGGRTYGKPNETSKTKQPIAAYTDFNEIPQAVADTLTDAINQNMARYPFMKDHFSFVGSTQAPLARSLGDNIDVDDEVEAFYRPERHGGRGRLCFSLHGLRLSQILSDSNKYHPIGTNNPKGTADHEFGHALWHKLGFDGERKATSKLMKYVNEYINTHSKDEIKDNLSYYANTDPGEFFAEAFSELHNNPNPRPVARKIGELLNQEIKEQGLD